MHLDFAVLLELGHDGVEIGEGVELSFLDGVRPPKARWPTPDVGGVAVFQAGFRLMYRTKKLGEEPGAVTPIFMPVRRRGFVSRRLSLRSATTMPGNASSISAARPGPWPACG